MGKIRISLKVKMIGVVLAVALVIACAAVLVSYTVYANTMDTHYETLTMNLARTTASMLDKGQVQALTDGVMETYRAQCGQEDTPPDFDGLPSRTGTPTTPPLTGWSGRRSMPGCWMC